MFVRIPKMLKFYDDMCQDLGLPSPKYTSSSDFDSRMKEVYGIEMFDTHSNTYKIIDYDKFLIFQLTHGKYIEIIKNDS